MHAYLYIYTLLSLSLFSVLSFSSLPHTLLPDNTRTYWNSSLPVIILFWKQRDSGVHVNKSYVNRVINTLTASTAQSRTMRIHIITTATDKMENESLWTGNLLRSEPFRNPLSTVFRMNSKCVSNDFLIINDKAKCLWIMYRYQVVKWKLM